MTVVAGTVSVAQEVQLQRIVQAEGAVADFGPLVLEPAYLLQSWGLYLTY